MPAGSERSGLVRAALDVLARNRRGAWTCPSAGIYPHQWLWDSCFIAIGLAAHDPLRAADEVKAALRGQWSNGMVPHMVFADSVQDAGSTRLWQSRRDPRAPRGVDTSCITQPPILAIAVRYVSRHLTGEERRSFLLAVMPKIVEYHRWLYRERDLEHCGLVTLIHPWECGLDTTPPWMAVLRELPQPRWLRLVLRWRLTRLVRFLRRDTRFVPAVERSSDDDGLRMLVLARRLKQYGFDLRRLPPSGSVRVQDVSFNALLVVANRMLLTLAEEIGLELDAHLTASFRDTTDGLEDLWDESVGRYCSRDTSTGQLLTTPTIATFVVLWAGSRSDRARRLIQALHDDGWSPAFPVPSVRTDAPQFDAARYWKGPTWINTNWLVIQGLRARREVRLAGELRATTLRLIEQGGFGEYFSPLTGERRGADDFSWTAALTLELLQTAGENEASC